MKVNFQNEQDSKTGLTNESVVLWIGSNDDHLGSDILFFFTMLETRKLPRRSVSLHGLYWIICSPRFLLMASHIVLKYVFVHSENSFTFKLLHIARVKPSCSLHTLLYVQAPGVDLAVTFFRPLPRTYTYIVFIRQLVLIQWSKLILFDNVSELCSDVLLNWRYFMNLNRVDY